MSAMPFTKFFAGPIMVLQVIQPISVTAQKPPSVESGVAQRPSILDLHDRASTGDVNAYVELGRRYEHGDGVRLDTVQAARWYQKAADAGYAPAEELLRLVKLKPVTSPAAAHNAAVAQPSAVPRPSSAPVVAGAPSAKLTGGKPSANDVADFARLKQQAEGGDAESQYRLAVKYDKGIEVTKNMDEAARWFTAAAMQNHPWAQYNLGLLYKRGLGVEKDLQEAVRLYRLAADAGVPNAQHSMGLAYYEGSGLPKDPALAAAWFRKAAEQGNTLGESCLGSMLLKGLGIPKNEPEGWMWIERAAAKGEPHALGELKNRGR